MEKLRIASEKKNKGNTQMSLFTDFDKECVKSLKGEEKTSFIKVHQVSKVSIAYATLYMSMQAGEDDVKREIVFNRDMINTIAENAYCMIELSVLKSLNLIGTCGSGYIFNYHIEY